MMKINVIIFILFSFFSISCADSNSNKKLVSSSKNLIKKGVPAIAKKVALAVTIGAISSKAQAEYSQIENKEGNTDIENTYLVAIEIYNDEKKIVQEISNDIGIIYTFGMKPNIKIAKDFTLEKSKDLKVYYDNEIKPDLEKKYKEISPIIDKKIGESKEYLAKEWVNAKPEIEKEYDILKNIISTKINNFLYTN